MAMYKLATFKEEVKGAFCGFGSSCDTLSGIQEGFGEDRSF